MDVSQQFALLARYNRRANERLYQACSELDGDEYKRPRTGSFGSIHALLNHALLSDGIWLDRFQGGGAVTPPLDTILHEDFSALRLARSEQDLQIENFFAVPDPDFATRVLSYVNSQGNPSQVPASLAAAHFFNHQTHHRGQLHVMLSHAGIKPISLDLFVILR